MTDQDRILAAVGEAQQILAAYIEPGGPRDPEEIINRLLSVLDNRHVVTSFRRLQGDQIRERFDAPS